MPDKKNAPEIRFKDFLGRKVSSEIYIVLNTVNIIIIQAMEVYIPYLVQMESLEGLINSTPKTRL